MTTLPPLLLLAEGRQPRVLQRTAQPKPRESVLHFQVAKLLRKHALPDWQWTHWPGGEEIRDARTAAKLKQMGAMAGWPDFVLVPPIGQLHSLELKRIGEDLTDEQAAFRDWCLGHRLPYAVARSISEVLAALDRWGALRIKIGGAR